MPGNNKIMIIYHSLPDNSIPDMSEWINQFILFLKLFFERNQYDVPDFILVDEHFDGALPVADAYILILTLPFFNDSKIQSRISEIESNSSTYSIDKNNPNLFKIIDSDKSTHFQSPFLLQFKNYTYYNTAAEKETQQEEEHEQINQNFALKNTIVAYDLIECLKNKETGLNFDREKTVYISTTTPDREEERDILARELKTRGYQVLPRYSVTHEDQIRENISKSALSVHIFGSERGPDINGTSLNEIQNNIAASIYNQNQQKDVYDLASAFSRIIWIPPDLHISDETYQLEIEKLKTDPIAMSGAELVQTPMETLKTVVISRLSEKQHYQLKYSGGKAKGKKIYFILDRNEPHIIELYKSVAEKNEIVPVFELKSRNYLESVTHHRQQLIECDTIVILYQNTSDKWLTSKIQDIRKAPGYGRSKPFINNTLIIPPEYVPDPEKIENTVSVVKTNRIDDAEPINQLIMQMH